MTSWVYVLSKFTPEALLLEASVIFLLLCGYTVFWVLRKRRYGAVETQMPAGPVREYLNELIGNAEQIRAQLFGLLAASGHIPTNRVQHTTDGPSLDSLAASHAATPAPGATVAMDGEAAQKLAALETKLGEQAKAMEALVNDKSRLEKDLASAKSAASAGGAAPAEDVSKLQAKITELEGKLAEYNVIEDDLANLKRLQQENTQLKATLANAGAAPPAAAAAPPAAAPAPADETAFAGLAAQVDQSLAAAPAAPAAPAAASGDPAAPDAAAAPADPNAPAGGSTDADLVAEFEKMLKG